MLLLRRRHCYNIYSDELWSLRTRKLTPGERREALHIPGPHPPQYPPAGPPEKPDDDEEEMPFDERADVVAAASGPNGTTTHAPLPPTVSKRVEEEDEDSDDEDALKLLQAAVQAEFPTEKKDDDSDVMVVGQEEASRMDQDLMNDDDDDEEDHQDHNLHDLQVLHHLPQSPDATPSSRLTTTPTRSALVHPGSNDSHEIHDDDDDDDENANTPAPPNRSTAGKVSVMFQRLFHMAHSPQSEQSNNPQQQQSLHPPIVAVEPEDDQDVTSATTVPQQQQQSATTTLTPSASSTTVSTEEVHGPPTAKTTHFPASLWQNGRMVCNLPDHPIHAGATAVVAVLVGHTLTVANAGDSRAVLGRGGVAFPLSFDHKPNHEVELARIQGAGGFVNHFGRVNGNLNLSRSIGDLKYKQVAYKTPAEQMITAEPDLVQVQLVLHKDDTDEDDPDVDEFFILGCDGIWDCVTNQQAVDYVRNRIDTQRPTEIGAHLLDEIISADPRTTQGIGGDNMTILIVDLQPHSRSYYRADNNDDNTATLEPAGHSVTPGTSTTTTTASVSSSSTTSTAIVVTNIDNSTFQEAQPQDDDNINMENQLSKDSSSSLGVQEENLTPESPSVYL